MGYKRVFSPSLNEIAERLFGLPDDLMFAIANDAQIIGSLPASIAKAISSSPMLQARIRRYRLSELDDTDEPTGTLDAREPTPNAAAPSPELEALFSKRAATAQHNFGKKGEPGQILRVTNLSFPEDPSGEDIGEENVLLYPQHVLLDGEYLTDTGKPVPGLWRAWLVGEDIDYMSWWDVLLEPEDEPYDPVCTHIQGWNKVLVRIDNTTRIVGRIAMSRLQAVRYVWSEYASGAEPELTDDKEGLITRHIAGVLPVRCGPPIVDETDSRWAYREMYFKVGETIKQPALAALRSFALEHKPKKMTEKRPALPNEIQAILTSFISLTKGPSRTRFAAEHSDVSIVKFLPRTNLADHPVYWFEEDKLCFRVPHNLSPIPALIEAYVMDGDGNQLNAVLSEMDDVFTIEADPTDPSPMRLIESRVRWVGMTALDGGINQALVVIVDPDS